MPFRGAAPSPDGAMKWRAKWIWIPGKSRPTNVYLFARKVFELRSAPGRALLHCTADSRYKLYVNGRYLGRGPARSLPAWQSFDTYDVTPALKRGKNTIGFIVHHVGEPTGAYQPGRGGLLCQMDLDRESAPVVSDETWRVAQSEAWTPDGVRMGPYLGFQEVYDAGLSIGDWTASSYDDSAWQEPEVIGKPPTAPWENLEPRIAPRYAEASVLPAAVMWARKNDGSTDVLLEEIPSKMATEALSPPDDRLLQDMTNLLSRSGAPATVKCPRDGGVSVLLDFGKQVFGTLELRLKASEGGMVDIGYAEDVDGGRIVQRRGDVLCADRYITRRGRQVWHTFEPRSFRYLQLDFRGCAGRTAIDRIQVQQILYDTGRSGGFECSDQQLDRVWQVGVNTLKLCLEDAIVNSPRRERRTAWEDVYFAARAAYYAIGDTDLLTSAVIQGIRAQNPDGSVPAWVPAPAEAIDPESAMFFVWCAGECFSQTGDRELLGDILPAVDRLLSWFRGYVGDDGLLRDVGEAEEGLVESCGLNCLYRETLRRAARLAEAAGRAELAHAYRDRSDDVRLAINKFLWASRSALYADSRVSRRRGESFGREANVMALAADVPDHYQRAALMRQLASESGEMPPITSPLYASLLVEALCRTGQYEDAVRLMREGWSAMAARGAFGESLAGDLALVRAFAVGPVADLCEHILGVRPYDGARVRIAPHAGGLQRARGTVPTPAGDLYVEWRAQNKRFAMKLDVPGGMEAEVASPIIEEGAVMSVDRQETDSPVAVVGAGKHEIEVVIRPVKRPAAPRRRVEDLKPPKPAESKPARWTAATPYAERRRPVRRRPVRRPPAEAPKAEPKKPRPTRRKAAPAPEPPPKPVTQERKPTPRRRSRRTTGESKPSGEMGGNQ